MGKNGDLLSEQELKDRINETYINRQLNECKKYLEKLKKDYPHSIYFEYFGKNKLEEIHNRLKSEDDQFEDYQDHKKQIQKKPVKENNKENIVTVKYQPVYSENNHVKESPVDEIKIRSLLIKCESCQNNFSKRALKCPKCGWFPTATCEICSKKIPLNSEICPECGDPYPFENQKKQLLQNPVKKGDNEDIKTIKKKLKYTICTNCNTKYSSEQLTCDNCGRTYLKLMEVELNAQDAQEFNLTGIIDSHQNLQQPQVSKKTVEVGAIWNPNAASNWSIIFTPAFGTYLHALNWRKLGFPDYAQSAMVWFYFSLGMLFVYLLMGLFITDEKGGDALARVLGFLYLIVWYFSAGRAQAKYVKGKFGSDYPRRSWSKPLLIGIAAIVGYIMLAMVLGLIVGTMSV